MSKRTIDPATYDAFRVTTVLSVFLFCLTFIACIFGAQNEEALRRCMAKNSQQADLCMLTVYGR
ncbi:hypothetical protein [uncultured Mediterranean phage uvMED]|nr:hypothetical protein [uncultured Mediterranean phage uvMED]BAQ93307.1 hypothetical protein [uncultured Mediterranean phage uvMED]BAQ93386.1 hypothetical protein [uncultured Mediterranean phage uvMED]BAR24580.1 hypothetical protein [uncultured Mediterranean phage uvMED]